MVGKELKLANIFIFDDELRRHVLGSCACAGNPVPGKDAPSSASVSQHTLCKLRESRDDVTGVVNWKSLLLTFRCCDIVLGKCEQSECHGAIQLTSRTWLECPT